MSIQFNNRQWDCKFNEERYLKQHFRFSILENDGILCLSKTELSALFRYFLSHAKHFPTVWKPVRIYSSSSRRLSIPLIKWSMMKWASFISGSFSENNDLMNEWNNYSFTHWVRFFRANFRCTVKIKLRECVLLLPMSHSSCEHLEMLTLGTSQIILSLGIRFIFLQQNPWEYQCSNCQSLLPEVDSMAERFSLRQSELFPCSGDIC